MRRRGAGFAGETARRSGPPGVPVPATGPGKPGRLDAGAQLRVAHSKSRPPPPRRYRRLADYGRTQPTCYEFKGAGLGKGKCVWNDAASAKNNTTGHTIFLYFADTHFVLSVGQSLNINNRDTSHKFIAN
ncbi:hypothetical protein [Amycolatopsis sp. NBC_01286]|uniref:hypothetical protein n=1 Tax=Amycolatopsis sp. NBC_01286 TaxID=2903560 RepID=UPI002E0F078B|nr:hypothetical protein OG570_29895 [Amycolatopsis sp. NBC_01286]